MQPFDYIRCRTAEEACAVLDAHAGRCTILAGGTDLLLELRRPGEHPPGVVADIWGIASLRGVTEGEGVLSIGALTTHADLLRSPIVQERAGFLSVAAGSIGSPQIRNRGTIGGNIMNAAACADTVPPLVALGAQFTLRSTQGERIVDAASFFERPYRTFAGKNELLTKVSFPSVPSGCRTAFIKLGRRNALSIARLSVAAMVRRDAEGIIIDARIVPGAALPVWKRIPLAEDLLIGHAPSDGLFEAAGEKASQEMIELTGRRWSTEYKEPVLRVLVQRALAFCCRDGGGLG